MATGDIFTVDISNGNTWNVNRNCTILKYMFPFQYMWATDINDYSYATSKTSPYGNRNIVGSARVYGVFLRNRGGSPTTLIAKMEVPFNASSSALFGPGGWDSIPNHITLAYLRDEDNFMQYPSLNTSRQIAFTASIPGHNTRIPTCSLRLVLVED